MSAEKSELKMRAHQEMAEAMEKAYTQAERNQWKQEGAREILARLETQFNLLCTAVRNEMMRAKKLPFDPKNPVEVGQWVNAKIQKGNQKIHEFMILAYEAGMRYEGQKKGLKDAAEEARAMANNERAKLEQAKLEQEQLEQLEAEAAMAVMDYAAPFDELEAGANHEATVNQEPPADTIKPKAKPRAQTKGKAKAKAKAKTKAKAKPKAKPKKAR